MTALFSSIIDHPITGYATCDSEMTVYADGIAVVKSMNREMAKYLEVPWYTEVLSIKVSYIPLSIILQYFFNIYKKIRSIT